MKFQKILFLWLLIGMTFGLTGCDRINLPGLPSQAEGPGVLKASGAITTVRIRIAPEISGKIVEIAVQKGDAVQAGDLLFRIDDELLKVQREQTAATITAAELELLSSQKALRDLKKNADVQLAQAQMTLAKARTDLDNAQKKQVSITYDRATKENLENARAQFTLTQKAVDAAQKVYDKLSDRPESDPVRSQATVNLNNLKKRRDQAKAALDWLLGFPTDLQVGEREAALQLAEAMVNKAQRDVDARQNGPDPEELVLVEARVRNAESQLERVKAALNELDIRIQKTQVTAPSDGVVLDIPVNVGEMGVAGATAVEIGQLNRVTLNVYIPEDQYGRIQLGQEVKVSVDSFPGKIFPGQVTRIAEQAEFTPRNVQTVETRSTTVYAIEITLDNSDLELKPGMPADAEFVP